MNTYEKTAQMKKYIFANTVFISVQIILVILSIIFNLIFNDAVVFLTVFVHVCMFVLYNVVVESIIEFGYLRKKYARICDETHYLNYFKLKKRMYKTSKAKKDKFSSTLILQTAIKTFVVMISIISLLFMVTFE